MSASAPELNVRAPAWRLKSADSPDRTLAHRTMRSLLHLVVYRDRDHVERFNSSAVGASTHHAPMPCESLADAQRNAERIAVVVLAHDLATLIHDVDTDERNLRLESLAEILTQSGEKAEQLAGEGLRVMTDERLARAASAIAEEQRRRRQDATVIAASAEFDQVAGGKP